MALRTGRPAGQPAARAARRSTRCLIASRQRAECVRRPSRRSARLRCRRACPPRQPRCASSASASARSRSAVLASASAMPGPRAAARAGMSSRRTRVRVKAGSLFCGSSQGCRPSAAQAAGRLRRAGSAAAAAGSGRTTGAIPASERAPDPRARPKQHRLCLIVQRVAEHDPGAARRARPLRRQPSSAAYLADRAAASGPW